MLQGEHDASHARAHVELVKAELRTHLQHGRVLGQHIAVHAPQSFFSGVVDDAMHQQPAQPVPLEARAYQDGEFRRLLVELIAQAHEPEHLARAFVERDESHLVRVVEVA